MSPQLQQQLERLQRSGAAACLGGIRRGIEREALRVTESGALSMRPHPSALGSALTHPQITTDFCEAQPEMVTGIHTDIPTMLQELEYLHAFVWQQMDGELLWPLSMPCRLPDDDDIPLARYGSSHAGRLKELYRLGLKYRYGASMQTISGMHYNFSLPDEFWQRRGGEIGGGEISGGEMGGEQALRAAKDEGYLAIARNFMRDSWVLLYLLGASPIADATVTRTSGHGLKPWPHGGYYLPTATSLRNGQLGYSTSSHFTLQISCDSLQAYCDDMEQAMTTPHPPWVDIARQHPQRVQISSGQLQIENELYDPIRLKCIDAELRPLSAMRQHGVRHLEIRCVDICPESCIGIDESSCRLLDLFLLRCLCLPSPPQHKHDRSDFIANNQAVVQTGLKLDTPLMRGGQPRPMGEELRRIADEISLVAQWLEGVVNDGEAWRLAAEKASVLAVQPEQTPASRQLTHMREHGMGLCQYGMETAQAHREQWQQQPLNGDQQRAMATSCAASVMRQQEIEAATRGSFEDYLASQLQIDATG